MLLRLSTVFFTFSLFMMSTLAQAGIVVGGTRVIYYSNKPDATISVINKETTVPYLIQGWVDPFDKTDTSKPPFTVIPPVSRLEAQQEKVLRIIKTQGELPKDRESVFWLNIKNIPPASDREKTNTLEIAVKTRIKFFWRPAEIKDTPESVVLKLKWQIQNQKLVVTNPSAIHINVMDVAVDGKDVPLNIIRPFETLTLPLPSGVSGKSLLWHFINDYGAISKDIKIKL